MKKQRKEIEVSVPASEAWLYRSPKVLASVRRGLADAAGGRTKSLGSFARYADITLHR